MEPIMIKMHVSKAVALAQGATAWGDCELPLTPEIAAELRDEVVATNDPRLLEAFTKETHQVTEPSLALAYAACRGTLAARRRTVAQVLANFVKDPGNAAPVNGYYPDCIPLWGDAQQIAEYHYTRKAWEKAQDAARMTAYRASAEAYLKNVSTKATRLYRPPSLIAKDAELDARINAHSMALTALAEHEAALEKAVTTAIKRGILKLHPEDVAAPLLAQFDDDELRDVELLDTLAGFAETWVRAADPSISVTRLRGEIEHYQKPSPAQYQMLRRIEDQARGWALAKSAARLTCDQCDEECGRIVDQEATHGIRARLGTWTNDKYPDNTSKYHDVVEITYTIRATVELPPLTLASSPAQFPLRRDIATEWALNFIIA